MDSWTIDRETFLISDILLGSGRIALHMTKMLESEDKSVLGKEPILMWRKYRVCFSSFDDIEPDEKSNKAMRQIEELANWIDYENYMISYYTNDLEDARKVKQKAMEIFEKAGLDIMNAEICFEEMVKNIDYPEGYLREEEYIIE